MKPLRPTPVLVAMAVATGLCACAGPSPSPDRAPAPPAATLRIVAYNIKHGRGMDGEVDLERIAGVLRPLDPDVVTLQEVDDRTERTSGVDQAGVLAGLLGMRPSFGAHRPYQGGAYGNAVLARLPVLDERTHPIAPSGGSALTVHEVVVDVEGLGPVSVVSVHLAGSEEVRLAQVDSLRSRFGGAEHPVVLAGDLNSRRGGPVLTRLARDWSVLAKDGEAATFPADAPDREIDFVLVRPPDAFETLEHRVIDETAASDHRPILAVLRVRAGSAAPGTRRGIGSRRGAERIQGGPEG